MPVDYKRSECDAQAKNWQRCRDVIEGEDAVKARGVDYLPMLSGQTPTQYEAYKMRALFFNGTARTTAALTGNVFRKPAAIEFPESQAALTKDVTLSDTPADGFALNAIKEILAVGRYGVLVDMQGMSVPETARRPYLVGYRAEQIINWRTRQRDGDSVLEMVVLQECVEEPEDQFQTKEIEQWRVLELLGDIYAVTLWRKREVEQGDGLQKKTEYYVYREPMAPTRRGATLNFIPFVVWTEAELTVVPAKPPLADMAIVNLSLYRTSADLEHGCHWTALPTPVIIGAQQTAGPLKIGAGECIDLPIGGSATMLEFKGEGLGTLERREEAKQEMMAVLGARLIESNDKGGANETATAVRAKHGATHSVLKTIAVTTSLALTKVFRILAWWAGAAADPTTETISVTLNTEFEDMRLTPEEAKTLLLMVQAGRISHETFYDRLSKGEWTRPGITLEQEIADIQADELAPEPEPEPGKEPEQ